MEETQSRTGAADETPAEPAVPAHAAHFYRSIFEHSVWGIFQTTQDGFYLVANRALARIYGYDSAEELLEAMTDIGAQLYVDRGRRGEFVRAMRERGVLSGFESQVRRRDGSLIWISESCREVRGIDGEFLYYEGMVEEITARKAAEEELLAAKEQAEAASRAKTEFLATISHELRTPLNAVIGFAEMIRDEAQGPIGAPVYRDYARDIWNSGRHLLSIIGDILDFVLVESGTLKLQIDEFDLGELTRSAAQLVQPLAQNGRVSVRRQVGDGAIVARGDERRLRQVLINLLGNAVKFTPEGGAVDLTVTERDDAIVIEIRDTGIGMSEQDLARVGKPFQQADSRLNRKYEGTGLGLAISDRLVRLHGGELKIASQLGHGTQVTVTLPRP
jgi:PAS domain S-box-containing protein